MTLLKNTVVVVIVVVNDILVVVHVIDVVLNVVMIVMYLVLLNKRLGGGVGWFANSFSCQTQNQMKLGWGCDNTFLAGLKNNNSQKHAPYKVVVLSPILVYSLI